MQAFKTSSHSTTAVKAIWKLQRPLYSPLNRHFNSPNLRYAHQSMIVKLLRKQDWEDLLHVSFPHSSSKQKAISLWCAVCFKIMSVLMGRFSRTQHELTAAAANSSKQKNSLKNSRCSLKLQKYPQEVVLALRSSYSISCGRLLSYLISLILL